MGIPLLVLLWSQSLHFQVDPGGRFSRILHFQVDAEVIFSQHSQGLGGNSGQEVVGGLFHGLDFPIFLSARSWSYGMRDRICGFLGIPLLLARSIRASRGVTSKPFPVGIRALIPWIPRAGRGAGSRWKPFLHSQANSTEIPNLILHHLLSFPTTALISTFPLFGV